MNIVVIDGRITKDLELKSTKNGKNWVRFSVAVDRQGEGTDFIDCTAWSKTAENMVKYLSKGAKVLVSGRIQTGSYEKDGRTIYTTEVVANNVEFLDSKKAEKTEAYTEPEAVDEDELPFS